MKNENESASVSENENESESVSENKNESENEIENESVSESENKSENEFENESMSEGESESENESVSENVNEIQHPCHPQHPLVLVAEQSNEGLKAHCDGCGELLSVPCFTCIHCNYHLHKQCAEAPLEIPNHPLHPEHSGVGLFLRQRPHVNDDLMLYIFVLIVHSSFTRNALMSYPLKLITLHIAYTLLFLTVVIVITCATHAKSNIPDLFTVVLFAILTSMLNVLGRGLLLKIEIVISIHSPYLADKIRSIVMHVALKEIIFHIYVQHAASWSIRIALHSHASSSFLDMITAFFTNIFFKHESLQEHRSLYKVIEEEKQCEELEEKSMQSAIIRIIEVNEAGEATKIEHFSHQHCLVLADKMEEEIDRKCDGCMLPVSNIFYYCSECPFFLHKTCAELPISKQHWFHQSNATLNFHTFTKCYFCSQYSSGFFYRIRGYMDMCLRCAKVADIIECEGHQHFLFFDFKCEEKCNGCGNRCWNGAFRCGKCRFALDFGCLTLPHSALHKIDEHKLKLTYHDDKEQSYCDICEQYRDPRLWYYSCSICDTSAHPECVLGKFPFLNDGVTFASYGYHNHHHDLNFFREVEGFPECSYCGKLCQEEILKCENSTCNFIVHYKCRRGH
ncbi:uncharacterized protein LOC105772131 [Gossypium raimondii]|uniref:uncharacterized protein LOC105772131 n=1 Tax=Gossypium raimondii TaxID=29730 RepID=UPI00227CBF43|nr:uncharacterized protein LOC105772131 [Gossypium raimondii]